MANQTPYYLGSGATGGIADYLTNTPYYLGSNFGSLLGGKDYKPLGSAAGSYFGGVGSNLFKGYDLSSALQNSLQGSMGGIGGALSSFFMPDNPVGGMVGSTLGNFAGNQLFNTPFTGMNPLSMVNSLMAGQTDFTNPYSNYLSMIPFIGPVLGGLLEGIIGKDIPLPMEDVYTRGLIPNIDREAENVLARQLQSQGINVPYLEEGNKYHWLSPEAEAEWNKINPSSRYAEIDNAKMNSTQQGEGDSIGAILGINAGGWGPLLTSPGYSELEKAFSALKSDPQKYAQFISENRDAIGKRIPSYYSGALPMYYQELLTGKNPAGWDTSWEAYNRRINPTGEGG